MTGWLDPIDRALAASSGTTSLFIRDDDAGIADDRLEALLDVVAEHDLAIDLAAVPTLVTGETVDVVAAAQAARPGAVGVHQHGFAHANHEREGRSCEFGPSRTTAAQARDIDRGAVLLEAAFGGPVDRIFTPPWNRCTAFTAQLLAARGLVLSRIAGAPALEVPGLVELPTHVDWYGKRRRVPMTRTEVAMRLAVRIEHGGPVGLLLHHAVMDDAELADLDRMLRRFAEEGVRPVSMRSLLGNAVTS